MEELIELVRFRELVGLWTGRNIKLRYKRSFLGILWTLLEPLMLMTILTVVFSWVFRFELESGSYPVYLLSGLLLFDFFSRTTLQIVEECCSSQSLASRVHVPRSVFAVSTVLSYLVSWSIALLPLLAIMIALGHPLTVALLTIPAGMILTGLLALGIGLVVATIGASFHDVKLTYQVLLTGWMYATPIIYPLSIVPESFRKYFLFNPLLHRCEIVRQPAFTGTVAPAGTWLAACGSSFIAALLGWWIFTSRRASFDYRG